jgi:hypothetical protein
MVGDLRWLPSLAQGADAVFPACAKLLRGLLSTPTTPMPPLSPLSSARDESRVPTSRARRGASMTWWGIRDGFPGLADCTLVAVGPVAGIMTFVRAVDPVLNPFERAGLLYLGYAVLFLVFGSVGALGFVLFQRNQRKLRSEFIVPRMVFLFAAPVLFLVSQTLLMALFFPGIVRGNISLDMASVLIDVGLGALLWLLYVGVVFAALRWPGRTGMVAVWSWAGLIGLGVVAKLMSLMFNG